MMRFVIEIRGSQILLFDESHAQSQPLRAIRHFDETDLANLAARGGVGDFHSLGPTKSSLFTATNNLLGSALGAAPSSRLSTGMTSTS